MKKFIWEDINSLKENVATTLLINIKAIKGLLETEGLDMIADTLTMTQIVKALGKMSTEYTGRLRTLSATHATLTGLVPIEKNVEYLFFSQEYHNLHTDILTMVTGLTRVLVTVQEAIVNNKEESHVEQI